MNRINGQVEPGTRSSDKTIRRVARIFARSLSAERRSSPRQLPAEDLNEAKVGELVIPRAMGRKPRQAADQLQPAIWLAGPVRHGSSAPFSPFQRIARVRLGSDRLGGFGETSCRQRSHTKTEHAKKEILGLYAHKSVLDSRPSGRC
jgi:hypothetical protein